MQVLQLRDIRWERGLRVCLQSLYHLDFVRNQEAPMLQVEHGIESFISTIQYFKEDGEPCARWYLMDDRGLVSSVIYYER